MTKIESYLGFAIRSGNVIFGYDKLFDCKKTPKLVLVCSTQNEKVSNKVLNFCTDNNIECIKLDNLILSDLIKRENCKVIGVLDENLANAIRFELKMDN